MIYACRCLCIALFLECKYFPWFLSCTFVTIARIKDSGCSQMRVVNFIINTENYVYYVFKKKNKVWRRFMKLVEEAMKSLLKMI